MSSIARRIAALGRSPYRLDFTSGAAGVAFTRASLGQVFGSTLALEQKAINTPRFVYDLSSGLSRGLLIETARTNSIRNNTFAGVAAGTPGTAPTFHSWSTTSDSVTREIVGSGTEDGIEYVDVRFSGTPTATNSKTLTFETSANVAAVQTQTWSGSLFSRLIGGTTTNLTFIAYMQGRTSGGTAVMGGSFVPAPTSAALKTQRGSCTATLVGATIAGIDLDFRFSYTNGLAIDCTIRIGLPQLELSPFASSPIKTSSVIATRARDIASIVSSTILTYPTIIFRGRTSPYDAASERYVELSDGTSSNRFSFYRPTGGTMRFIVTTGAVTQAHLVGAVVANDTEFCVAARCSNNDFAMSLNGGAVITDVAGTRPTGLTTTLVGGTISNSSLCDAPVKYIEFRPEVATNAQLQALST